MRADGTKLAQSDEILLSEQALEAESSGVLIADALTPRRPIVYVNAAFERITGFSAEDVLGRDCSVLFGPDTDPEAVAEIRRAEDEGRRASATLRCYRKDGSPFWAEETITPIRDRDGQTTHFVGVVADVTDRRRTEQALRQSEARFRSAFEDAAVGMALVAPDGRFLRVNRALCESLGYAETELLALTFQSITHPDDLARDVELVRRTLAGEIDTYQLEKRYIRGDGELAWGHLAVSLVRDDESRPVHFVSQVKDITDRKRAESALAQSEERFRRAFEAAPIGMALTAVDGRFVRVNRALTDMLGYSEDELLGLHFGAITHPDDLDLSPEGRHVLVEEEADSWRLEKRYLHKDGHVVWAFLSASVLRDESGEQVGTIANILDITDRRRVDETLRLRDALLEAVASSGERLLRAERWEDAIGDVLHELGEAAQVSRSYVFRVRAEPSEYVMTQLHEWSAPRINSLVGNEELEDRRAEGVEAAWMEQLAAGHVVQAHLRELPREWARRIGAEDIESLILVPVQVDDRFWGFLGFDECRRQREWTAAESEVLRAAAGALGAAIQRREGADRRSELELRYRSLVERLPLTTYVSLLDASLAFISPQIEEVLGYSVDEWTSDPAFTTRIVHPDDREAVLDTSWPEDDGPHRYEYRLIARDGREVWFLDEYSILRDETGRRLYAQGYMVDITERKRMEEELRRTNELLRTVVHASPLAIIVTDPGDLVTFWNPAAERIYGWSGADVLGKRTPMRPPERAHEYETFRATCDRGQWISGFETERQRKDGVTIDISISLAPLRDASGNLVGLLGVHEDITERKRAEHALRQSEQHFRAVFDSALDGMAIYDDERNYVEVNDAFTAIHGRAREGFAGRRIDDFVIPERLSTLDDDWHVILQAGTSWGESEIQRPDGERRQVEYTVRANVHPGRHLSVVRDVTERRALESQLLQSQRLEAVGRLAGGIAHDFNNLLTAISGYGEFLFDALSDSDPLRRDVEEIQRASDRAAALIRQLLAFSRRQLVRARVVDLNEVIAETETLLRRLIGEDIELVTQLAPEISPIRADPSQLEQIVVNLAVNARDAMPAGGTLSIRTNDVEDGAAVQLTVTDTGVGMDADTRAHAFEPFFTTKEPGQGTGLGLSTVYGVVAQSGGTVDVRSEVGLGATFTIVLPALPGATPSHPPDRLRGRDATASETLLLVEDEPVVRELAERVLGSNGYAVLTAASGDEALDLAASHDGEIALLVTDVIMPGMNGRELAERLLALHPRARVLFTSGYTDDAFALDMKPGGFIGKPFTPDELRRKVRELLDADT